MRLIPMLNQILIFLRNCPNKNHKHSNNKFHQSSSTRKHDNFHSTHQKNKNILYNSVSSYSLHSICFLSLQNTAFTIKHIRKTVISKGNSLINAIITNNPIITANPSILSYSHNICGTIDILFTFRIFKYHFQTLLFFL